MTNKIERLKEIITMANKLCWISRIKDFDYPIMQLSEVEKCMMAMVDDLGFNQIKVWYEDKLKKAETQTTDSSEES